MGEAKELVGTPSTIPPRAKRTPTPAGDRISIIERLEQSIEDLDKAITVKQADLLSEGKGSRAENHYKLGILRATDSLLRRAAVALKDYGTDLQYDLDPTLDAAAALGNEFEGGDIDDSDDEEEEKENA